MFQYFLLADSTSLKQKDAETRKGGLENSADAMDTGGKGIGNSQFKKLRQDKQKKKLKRLKKKRLGKGRF